MPQYYLDRYFVPDDKDLYDMLAACNTSHEKLWQFARNYGILTSATEPKERLIDNASSEVANRLRSEMGLKEVYVLTGGWAAWKDDNP
jgi:ligand-binding SRPBCC domain-containing protein